MLLDDTCARSIAEAAMGEPAAGGLREIADPAERARRASALIDDLAAQSGQASAIRAEALAEMSAAGMTQTDIARATGMTRARISQIMKAAPTPGQALLVPDAGPLTICVIEKPGGDRGEPSIMLTTRKAAGQLKDLAASYDIRAETDYIPVSGRIDLNRPNLAVLIGPRSSALIAQAITAEPVIKWAPDDRDNWFMTDTRTGTEYHSEFDSGWGDGQRKPRTCYAHVGRIRRPDGEGSWLCLAGAHSRGVAGAVEIFCRDIGHLWDQAHRSLWGAIAQVTAGEGGVTEDVTLVTPVYVHGRR
jgi:transcriptional regulator with XRE-family HTH domain